MTTTSTSRPSALGALGDDVAAVREREPFELADALAALTRDDLEHMSAAQAEVVLAATQRMTNALAALQAAAVTTYADRVDEDLERYREERRREFEERRDRAKADGRSFTERWHPIPGDGSFAAASLAPLLHISPRTMATRIGRARRLDHEMPATWAKARSGDLEPYRTDAVVRGAAPLEDDDLEEYEARLFADDVTDLSTGELADRARRAATATNREAVEEVAARARQKRSVTCRPDRDLPGMTSWRLCLPTETSRQMWAAVDELAREYHQARRDAGDPVTLDQARADAIADLVLARATVETTAELIVPVAALVSEGGVAATDGSTGDEHAAFFGDHGPRATGHGTYRWAERRSPAEVLRGKDVIDDVLLRWVSGEELHRASCLEAEYALLLTRHLEVAGNPNLRHAPPSEPNLHHPASSEPNHPSGSDPPPPGAWFVPGHVDDSRVGALLPDDLTALLADPATRIRVAGSDGMTGAAVTDSTDAYRPGRATVRRVRRRDGSCRFPGCATPAERCQLDHVTRWPDGPTEDANLVCLCTTHHGFKHHAGWRLTMTTDGTCTWTAPTGRAHATRPRAAHSPSV